MRRGPVVLTATAAVTAALLNFHPKEQATTVATARSKTAVATTSAGSSSSGSSSGTRTIAGAVEQTRYGPVQVQITTKNGRITDVRALQIPEDNPRSAQINETAGPLLREEALKAQSASIDGVSGATYTSQGYELSLESAVSQAGIS